MKQIFASLVMMAFLLATLAAAQSPPITINGKVSGFSGTLEVQVTNIRTQETISAITNSGGDWLIEWANSQLKAYPGDQFREVVVACSNNPACTQTLTLTSDGGVFSTFDVSGILGSPEPVPEPACPADTTPYDAEGCKSVVSCPIAEPCTAPEPGGANWTAVLISGLVSALVGLVAGMGGGIKAYKTAAGSVALQHKHKGVNGYHDVNISHSNPAYKHRRYKDNPLGCMLDVKKIEEKGGLI